MSREKQSYELLKAIDISWNKLNNTIKPQDNANINRLKSIIDTRIKMLEIVEENNGYKKKVIFTLISLIFLALIAMITIFINFSKFFKK